MNPMLIGIAVYVFLQLLVVFAVALLAYIGVGVVEQRAPRASETVG
jgi:hypothetical protein